VVDREGHVKAGRLQAAVMGWVRHRHRDRSDDSRYRSPQEIALLNAADSLGVELGEYYPDDLDLPDGLTEWSGDSARIDASREELLVFVERSKGRRRWRRRARRLHAAATCLLVVAVVVLAWDGLPTVPSGGGGESFSRTLLGENPSAPHRSEVEASLMRGHREIVYVTRVDRSGSVCATTWTSNAGLPQHPSAGRCSSPGQIAKTLLREPAIVVESSGGNRYFQVQGYARPDLRRIVVRGRSRGVKVALSKAWAPDGVGGRDGIAFKTFLVHVPFNLRSDPLAGVRAMQENTLQLLGELSDGRVLPVRLWSETRQSA
jgi:hypothetical protein